MYQSMRLLYNESSVLNEQVVEILNDEFESPVISRLIEEVRNESESTIHNYDRAHNRHNR